MLPADLDGAGEDPRPGSQAEKALLLKLSSRSNKSHPSQKPPGEEAGQYQNPLKKMFFNQLGTNDGCQCTPVVSLLNLLNSSLKKREQFSKVFSPIPSVSTKTVLKGWRRMEPRQTAMQGSPQPTPLPRRIPGPGAEISREENSRLAAQKPEPRSEPALCRTQEPRRPNPPPART